METQEPNKAHNRFNVIDLRLAEIRQQLYERERLLSRLETLDGERIAIQRERDSVQVQYAMTREAGPRAEYKRQLDDYDALLAGLADQITSKEEALVPLAESDEVYHHLQQEQMRLVKEQGGTEAERLLQMSEKIALAQAKIAEVEEAINAGDAATDAVRLLLGSFTRLADEWDDRYASPNDTLHMVYTMYDKSRVLLRDFQRELLDIDLLPEVPFVETPLFSRTIYIPKGVKRVRPIIGVWATDGVALLEMVNKRIEKAKRLADIIGYQINELREYKKRYVQRVWQVDLFYEADPEQSEVAE